MIDFITAVLETAKMPELRRSCGSQREGHRVPRGAGGVYLVGLEEMCVWRIENLEKCSSRDLDFKSQSARDFRLFF